MPITHKNEDGTEVELFTADELEEARTAAAAEAATAERERINADPNGTAAAARREAERKLKDANKDLTDLRAQLAKAGKTAEEIVTLKAQVADALTARDSAVESIESVKAEYQRDLALIGAGIKPERLPHFKATLKAGEIDPSDTEAVAAAIATAQAESPGWFTAQGASSPAPPATPPPPATPNGVAGSPSEPRVTNVQEQVDSLMAAGKIVEAMALKDANFNKE
jgi:hypothetical protein